MGLGFRLGADEPNKRLEGWAKGEVFLRRAGFGLVRIFTQSRKAAEGLTGMSDGLLREIEILEELCCLIGGLVRTGLSPDETF